MESIAVLIGIFLLVTFFMPWINHTRLLGLRDEIAALRFTIRNLEKRLSGPDIKTDPQPLDRPEQTVAPEEIPAYMPQAVTEPEIPSAAIPRASHTDWIKTAQDGFEKNIATKFPVWIGAVSLICAAFFLVKYSMELGWMKPAVRVSLGGLFGMSLLAAGQWIVHRPSIANFKRISQALVGAGLVALYVSIYASIHLYGLLPSQLGFGLMAAVTALAVILSLKHGQPIAVFGLLGGLLTPALIGSDEPNAIAMFSYLFLLFTGMFVVLVRKGWWLLAVLAVIGVFAWSVFWFLIAFSSADAMVLVVFAMAVVAVVLAVTGKRIAEDDLTKEESSPVHGLNFAAIVGGVVTIAWLSAKISLTLFDWSMLGLLSIALMILAYFKPGVYRKPLVAKLALSLLLYFMWAQNAPLANSVAVLAGMGAIYIIGGALLMRKVSDPRFWAGIQAIAAMALYLIAFFTLELPEGFLNSFGAFWGIISIIAASFSIYQAADIKRKYTADDTIQEHLVAIFALLASAFISAGLAIELPFGYLPLALAAQTTATALIYGRARVAFLKQICFVLTLVFVVLQYEQIFLFAHIMIHAMDGTAPYKYYIDRYVMESPLLMMAVPSWLFLSAFLIFLKNGNQKKRIDHALFGAALLFAMATLYYLFRYIGHGDYAVALSTPADFIERGVITLSLALAGFALLAAFERFNLKHLNIWAFGLLVLAGLRYIYFDLLFFNPYWDQTQNVGQMPLLNGVTLTFGGAGLLCTYAAHRKSPVPCKVIYKILGLISLFAFTTLSVRQYFHGEHLEHGTMSSAELYGYSMVWLATGIVLLTIGILKENKTARMASLAFMILAVLKVFLFDAAELEGLYRVFSFLGLGLSFIGLSYFYSKFVFRKGMTES